jgi:hypothetical protein
MTKDPISNIVIYLSAFISMLFSVHKRTERLMKSLFHSLNLKYMASNANTGSSNQDDNRQQQGQEGTRESGSQGNHSDSSK